ncbi:MAG TPA: peptidoglycan-binding protein [Pseudoneobacillus sp.]|nr:peptidoglycan-binding protein [Pseudoneobacillus sp.]
MDLQTLLTKAQIKASQLNPFLREKALELVKLAYNNDYQIIITQGYRSIEEQNALYAQGRTTPGNIVTNAKGGQSYHNWRLAFDIAVLNSDGSIDWNTDAKYIAIGKLGQSIGLAWGGAWTTFKDMPHFEYTYGYHWSDFMNGTTIPDYPTPPRNWLQKGDEGDAVKDLQTRLNKLGYNLTVDGDFGPATDTAVKDFQTKQGMAADGQVGPITSKKIDDVIAYQEWKAKMSKYFNDLEKSHWACETIDELHEMGIINGDGEGNVKPDVPPTKAEVAAMIRNTIRYITGK